MTAHVGILPRDVLDTLTVTLNGQATPPLQARFLSLLHPRTGVPALFLPYEVDRGDGFAKKSSILEVQAVSPPNGRSWFVGEREVIEDGKLLIMTPIDPALLLIHILKLVSPDDGTLGTFRQLDDILELAAAELCKSKSSDTSQAVSEKDILRLASLSCIKSAFSRVCDVKEITPDIVVYRFSAVKLVEYLRVKVSRMATSEVMDVSKTLIRGLAKDGLMEDGKEDLLQLGRIRAACNLIAHYIPPDIKAQLLASFDFKQLDDYMKCIEDEKAALALANADKKASEKKKKANGQAATSDTKKRKPQTKSSQGVEKLKKVNVNGMAKMSSFFKKA